MPKYTHIPKVFLPLTAYKTERTVSIATDGRKVFGGIGNEGLDVGLWIEEKIADGSINITNADLTALVTLTGVPAGSTDLGTFTGSIISDDTTIKNALQELETYIESSIGYTDEDAQDAVGSILTDSGIINFAYSDASNFISADLFLNSVTFDRLIQIDNSTLLGRYSSGTGDIQTIIIGDGLELDGDTLKVTVVPGSGTVTSVDLTMPSIFSVANSPITSSGSLDVTLENQAANIVFAGPSTGSPDIPSFRSLVVADIPTLSSTKISDFSEAVDDRVNALLVAGSNVTLTYNDGSNTLTIAANPTAYTDEDAQDAIGSILIDSDTINFTYSDATPSITAVAITQMSITSDSSGLKLLGDSTSPGNSKYYGTDGTGVKGFYSLSSISLPAGTANQTLRYDNTNTLVANSNILNDGTYVGIGGNPISGYRLYVAGGIRTAGILYSRGSGLLGSAVTNSEVRLENITGGTGQTWYMNSANTGELLIGTNAINPELTLNTDGDVDVENKLIIGNTTSVPVNLIGTDANGYVGALTLGTGLTIVGGELNAPAGSITSGTISGQMLYWDGAAWEVALRIKDVQVPGVGTTCVLPDVPITDLPVDVYINGVLLEETEDYSIASDTITFVSTLESSDKITTIYYI